VERGPAPGRPERSAAAGGAESRGVLVVDKPAGPTSFDVVRRVRRALGAAKAGHTGTLDPAATGVLAVCVDDAVKLQQWLVAGDKAYEALVAFGAATDTQDAEGKLVEERDASPLDAAAVAAALPRFVGELDQLPPMFSAVRVGGRRLHVAARAGEEVPREARRVRVDALELLAFTPGARATARLAVRCGKGTYVRTLAADLGAALGLPAHLAALRRTAAGPFTLAAAVPLAEVEALDPAALRARLVPLEEALAFMPAVRLTAEQAVAVGHGRALPLAAGAPVVRALSPEGRLVALLEPAGAGARPIRVFAAPGTR
jgi:tRNA pseudouridine55 synthase